MVKTSLWDASRYLDSPQMIAEYLSGAIEDGDTEEILLAFRNVSRAIGMTEMAKRAGVSRESLYKSLAPGAKPQFETVLKIIRAFGSNLAVRADNRTLTAEEIEQLRAMADSAFVGSALSPDPITDSNYDFSNAVQIVDLATLSDEAFEFAKTHLAEEKAALNERARLIQKEIERRATAGSIEKSKKLA